MGGIVLTRLPGEPSFVVHDAADSKLKFSTLATAGAPEHDTTSGVLYYEIEVLGFNGFAQVRFSLEVLF